MSEVNKDSSNLVDSYQALDGKTFQSHLIKIISIPVVLILVMLGYFHFQNSYRESLEVEIETLETMQLLAVTIEKSFSDMETGYRGFLISGDQDFLEPYYAAKNGLTGIKEDIFLALEGQYEGGRLFRVVLEKFRQWDDYSKKNIEAKKIKVIDIVNSKKLLPEGKKYFDEIREASSGFRAYLKKVRLLKAKSQKRIVRMTNILEAVFALLFALFIAYLVTKQLKDLTSSYRKLLVDNANSLKEIESSSKSKDLFLANMSHEIRTPLGAIMGFAELVSQNKSLDAEAKTHVSFIRRNSEHLFGLVDDLFDLSKVSADKLEIFSEEVNLKRLIGDLKNTFSSKINDKNITLNFKFDTKLPEIIITDPLRVRQILSNILGNAIKFSPKDSEVNSILSFKDEILVVDVLDQGIGIDPSIQTSIFDAFTQADDTHARKYGGAGLGLSISKKLANMMNGDILLIDSKVNVGSHFRFTVPIEKYESRYFSEEDLFKQDEVVKDLPVGSVAVDLSGQNILLAEDSKENQILFKIFIESAKGNLTIVENGTDAVRQALSNEYNLVLMDIQMPGMDGYEALKILKSSNYQKSVVALTAHTMKGEKEKCIKAGFDDYIAKPVSQNKLLSTIEKNL